VAHAATRVVAVFPSDGYPHGLLTTRKSGSRLETMRHFIRVATVITAVLLVSAAIVAAQAVGRRTRRLRPPKQPEGRRQRAGFPPP